MAEADLATYLRNDSEVAFDVSENRPPYRGVRGNGTTSFPTLVGGTAAETPVVEM